jgi:hypothetical protein
MRATVQALLLAAALVLGACGRVEIDEGLPATTSVRRTTLPTTAATTAAPRTTIALPTTAPPATVGGRTCLAIFNDGLEMTSQYIQDQKAVAGADEAKYKARAQGLADEARREGCQVPPMVEAFLR